MKPSVHRAIKQWRVNHPEKYREGFMRAAKKRLAWQSISTEFRRILIADHLPDFKETRGRKKKPSTFSKVEPNI